jgi:hypothetical protein
MYELEGFLVIIDDILSEYPLDAIEFNELEG